LILIGGDASQHVIAGDRQGAVSTGETAADQAADGHSRAVDADALDIVQTIHITKGEGAVGELAVGAGIGASGQAGLEHLGPDHAQARRVVAAGDGDGDLRARRVAVGILHGVVEGLGQYFTAVQALHHRQAGIEHVGIGTVSAQDQLTVETLLRANRNDRNAAVGPWQIVDQNVTSHAGSIFIQIIGIVDCRRRSIYHRLILNQRISNQVGRFGHRAQTTGGKADRWIDHTTNCIEQHKRVSTTRPARTTGGRAGSGRRSRLSRVFARGDGLLQRLDVSEVRRRWR